MLFCLYTKRLGYCLIELLLLLLMYTCVDTQQNMYKYMHVLVCMLTHNNNKKQQNELQAQNNNSE